MFNISLSPKKSILCIFLLTVLSACSANSQSGKNDAELNFEWYDTKQEADEALARFVKSGMLVEDALIILNKSGFACGEWRLIDAKKHAETKQRVLDGIHKSEEDNIKRGQQKLIYFQKNEKDIWSHDFPKTDFYAMGCSVSKKPPFFYTHGYGLTWKLTLILDQQDKSKINLIFSDFEQQYL